MIKKVLNWIKMDPNCFTLGGQSPNKEEGQEFIIGFQGAFFPLMKFPYLSILGS